MYLKKSLNQYKSFIFVLTKSYSSTNKPTAEIVEKYKGCFNCVYKFNYINHLRLFSRMKIYQTVFSTAFGLGSVVLYDMKIVDDLNYLLVANGCMLFALLMLLIISRQTVKVVGRIYLNDAKDKVILSHLNFLGKRRDVEVDLELIEPLSSLDELNESSLSLKLKNMDGQMYVSLAHGLVYDKSDFLKLFNVNLKKITKKITQE